MVGYFTTRVKLHGQWGPRWKRQFAKLGKGCLAGCWAPGGVTLQVPVMVLGVAYALFGFSWPLSLPT
jgi:hypothetical protein